MTSWTLAGAILPDLSAGGQPVQFDELWKAYEKYAGQVAESLEASNRTTSELSARYTEVADQIKSASDDLNLDLLDVHEQFQAELTAASKSPLVDRCKRAYQAMVESYINELAAAASTYGSGQPDLSRATHRAADAYSRAVDDLNAEMARQIAAAYGRYLSGLSRAASEADLSGLVATGNERLVHTLSQAYRATRSGRKVRLEPGGPQPEAGDMPEEAEAPNASDSEDQEDFWSGTGTSASAWGEAETPTWEDVVPGGGADDEASPWGQADTLTWNASGSAGDGSRDFEPGPPDDSPWGLEPAPAGDEPVAPSEDAAESSTPDDATEQVAVGDKASPADKASLAAKPRRSRKKPGGK